MTEIKNNKINPCRCPKCFLIPSIKIYEDNNKLKLNFICPNNHEFNDYLNHYIIRVN